MSILLLPLVSPWRNDPNLMKFGIFLGSLTRDPLFPNAKRSKRKEEEEEDEDEEGLSEGDEKR